MTIHDLITAVRTATADRDRLTRAISEAICPTLDSYSTEADKRHVTDQCVTLAVNTADSIVTTLCGPLCLDFLGSVRDGGSLSFAIRDFSPDADCDYETAWLEVESMLTQGGGEWRATHVTTDILNTALQAVFGPVLTLATA